MNQLVESIIIKEYTKADQIFHEEMNDIVSRKLNEAKKMYAAKMFSEQLNVDAKGKFNEAGGKDVVLSHEKQKRGLAEGDVVPLGDKFETSSYKVHVAKDRVIIKHKDTGITRIAFGGRPLVNIYRNAEQGLEDKHIEDILYSDQGKKPEDQGKKPETMKEEAKRAAMRIMQEKVRVKNVTPEKIKAAQKYSDKTSNENPTDPAALFRKNNRNTVVSMKKK
jgi:hypothetical protein